LSVFEVPPFKLEEREIVSVACTVPFSGESGKKWVVRYYGLEIRLPRNSKRDEMDSTMKQKLLFATASFSPAIPA
jgi:hypothetical protein